LVAGTDGCVGAVLTGHESLPAEIVVVVIGVEPRTELARKARISLGPQGGILTDRFTRTSLDSVYAAGDCCEVRNLVTNGWLYAPLATTASRMGWVAGENAAGGRAVFEGAVHAAAVRVFDLELSRVGLSLEESRASGIAAVEETIVARSRVAMMPGSSPLTVTLLADQNDGRLLGGCLFGREGAVLRGNTLAAAIQHRFTVEQLRRLDFAYAPPFSPLWDPLLVAANALARRLSLPSHKR
jgi:NADPH-dependent 2,4-dienoyl-CoA reductase/sulfur reductase-like enzyme